MLDCSWVDGSQPRAKEGQSIFRAQANEINTSEGMKTLTFQYTNLHNWMNVSVQVLGSVGRNSSCVYEDTLFPPRYQYEAINWSRIEIQEEQPQSRRGALSLSVLAQVREGVAFVLVEINEGGKNAIKEGIIIGRALRSTSRTLDSIG